MKALTSERVLTKLRRHSHSDLADKSTLIDRGDSQKEKTSNEKAAVGTIVEADCSSDPSCSSYSSPAI